MRVRLERELNDIENSLSRVSAIPLVGSLAGATKVVLGAAQSLTALTCGLFSMIPSMVTKDYTFSNRCLTHLKHGIGNIAAGIVEAVPGVQTLSYVVRKRKGSMDSDPRVKLTTHHENKFMPYKSLIERDFTFEGGLDEGDVEKVQETYNLAVKEVFRLKGDIQVTPKERYKIAKDVIDGKIKQP